MPLRVARPKDYGIDEAKYTKLMPTMAAQALASGSPGNNPVVPSAEEIIELYTKVYAPSPPDDPYPVDSPSI